MAKQLTFTISSYTVEINQQAFNSCYPTINLTGIAGHTTYEATVEFRPENPFNGGKMIGMMGTGINTAKFSAWFELAAFAGFYQVLSSEKPVSLKIETADYSGGPWILVESASLLTGKEIPGDHEAA